MTEIKKILHYKHCLNMYPVRPKKYLGQHFLKDENIACKIVNSFIGKHVNILEIGSGTGILSKYLITQKNVCVKFIEIDKESVEYFEKKIPEQKNNIIHADFLNYDISSIFQNHYAVIGNFPYNISSQILFKILDHKNQVDEVIGMFQKEVAHRIASPPGSKDYGILSVLLQAYYKIEILFIVNETCFVPLPKVKSAVIRLIRNNTITLDCNEKLFKSVVKSAFNQRRKTLRNALRPFSFDNTDNPIFSRRAETLSVDDFVFITNKVIQLT